jgi:hypothetical protein
MLVFVFTCVESTFFIGNNDNRKSSRIVNQFADAQDRFRQREKNSVQRKERFCLAPVNQKTSISDINKRK